MSSLIAGIPSQLIPILLLLVSVLGLTIIFERAYMLLRRLQPIDRSEERKLIDFLREKNYQDAISFCRLRNHPAFTIAAAVIEGRNDEYDLKSLSEEETLRQMTSLERYLPTLGTISTVAPLLGLLGTVTGMIKSFRAFEDTASRSSQLMGGIDEALITTALGLVIAIPALIMYNYFVRRVNMITEQSNILTQLVIAELEK